MIELTNQYYEIWGLYFEGGEERTKNLEWEVGQMEDALLDAEEDRDKFLGELQDALDKVESLEEEIQILEREMDDD